MNNKTINNWLKLAEYDLKTAKAMFDTKRYLYVAFTCQQSIEKVLKALFIKENNQTPPYTHNLQRLLESISIISEVDDDFPDFINELNIYYIESRYNEELEDIAKLLNKSKAKWILTKSEEIFKWLKAKIK